ncbi:unnamed protein product [Pylaiella littoralis]
MGDGASGSGEITQNNSNSNSGGSDGAAPAPANRTHAMYKHQQGSVGTALHAIDRVQIIAGTRGPKSSQKLSQKPGSAAAAASTSASAAGKVSGSAASARRGSISRPLGSSSNSSRTTLPSTNGTLPDNKTGLASGSGSGGSGQGDPVLPRRSSTGQLHSLVTMGSNFDSVTTVGTPGRERGGSAPITKGLLRATGSHGGHNSLGVNNFGTNGEGGMSLHGPPKNLREAIEAGDVMAVGDMVQALSQEEAEVDLVAQDREQGTPLMLAAAGKNAQTYVAVMDAIRSRLGVETLMSELQARDLRAWCPLMHAAWSGSAEVFRAVVVAIEDNLGRDHVAEQLASTAKYGWTPLHAAARGNAEAMGAVMASLVNYMEADELKEQLSQSHDKDSDLPTPLMFAAASSSLDSRSLNPLLSELLGCICDIDEARRQRTAVDYAAAYGRLDTLSCLIAYGCEISDQTVTTLLSGDLAVGASAFNRCIWKGITTARNPLIPCYNVLRAVGRAADRDAKHRQFLLRMQSDVDELVQEMLQQLPPNMAGFADNYMDTGQGFAAVQWVLEPEMAGKRIPTFTGPLARALETRRLEFFSSNIVLAYTSRKFSRGLPGMFSGASWKMPDMHNRDTKRFVLGLPYGAAPDNIVGAVRMRLCVPFELIQGSALRRTSLIPGLQFNCVGLASRPDAFYEVPAIRMAFDVVTYLSMLILFCFVVKLDSPSEIPAREIAFYAYMLGNMVNELGEVRYVRRLRGQSEVWNVVEAVLVGLVCAAFCFRIVALLSDAIQEEAFFLAQLFFAMSAPLFFSRVLFLAQIDENLGLMVQVLFGMLKEVVRFGVVIGVILLGFSMAMHALFGGTVPVISDEEATTTSSLPPEDDDDTAGVLAFDPFGRRGMQSSGSDSATQSPATFDISQVYLPSFSTFYETALTMFRAMFGDFDFDEFSGVRYGPAGVGLMVAFLVVVVLVLLNLLIAFLTGAHTEIRKEAKAKFHFTRTQIVQQWNRVVEHDVLPAPLNLVHLTTCLLLRPCVSKTSYPLTKMRIGCFLFWLVMGPLGAALAIAMWFVSIPWSIWHLVFGGQASKEVDRKSERLKYVFTAPGLVIISLLLGFLTIFVGDGSSDGTSSVGKQSSRNARKDKNQRGGDYDLAGLLKKLTAIGVDDLRRQLKNPLKDSQVLLRNAKMATTVEHVKQLRDDITIATQQSIRDTFVDSEKIADDRAARLESRMDSLENHLAKIAALLGGNSGSGAHLNDPGLSSAAVTAGGGDGVRSSSGIGRITGSNTASARGGAAPHANGSISMSNSRSVNSYLSSSNHQPGE